MRHLRSALDASQNFLLNSGKFGHLEARYVRRTPEYVAAYVSSHYGCNMGCKFCHLTHMEKHHRNSKMASLDDYEKQLQTVMDYVKDVEKDTAVGISKRINVNFMARGDAFANSTVINRYPDLHNTFRNIIPQEKAMKLNLSTIFPKTMLSRNLTDVLGDTPDTYMYYSLYSTNSSFRKYWLPNAIDYRKALEILKEYQESNGREITFHWAIIEGHNDCVNDVIKIAEAIDEMRFTSSKFNLVRFNSPTRHWHEPSEDKLEDLFSIISSVMVNKEGKSKIVSRVGKDIAASCGMFVN